MAGFRTVVISKQAKLEYRLGYLVIRADDEQRVHIDEIDTLIVELPRVAITGMLICELSKRGVNVLFCNEKHLPECNIVPCYGNTARNKNLKKQLAWNDKTCAQVWKDIITQKINMQAFNLRANAHAAEADKLLGYTDEIKDDDITNREGHAAKVYFNAMFSKQFKRSSENEINSALNYGYQILLSMFVREIVASGYLTEIGIWHKNEGNWYNLASDLMEVFRPIVDSVVAAIGQDEFENFKKHLLKIYDIKVEIDGEKQYLSTAVRFFVWRALAVLNGEADSLCDIKGFGDEL